MGAQIPEKRKHTQQAPLELLPDLCAEVDGLRQWIRQAAEDGSAAHEVERTLRQDADAG